MAKRILTRGIRLLLAVCFTFAVLAAAGTFSVTARAAERQFTAVIDGVAYQLYANDTTGERVGEVYFFPGGQKDSVGNYLSGEEVHIKSKVVYGGLEYEIRSVCFGNGSTADIAAPEGTSYANTLKKLTVDAGVKYYGGIYYYSALEDVVFEDNSQIGSVDFYDCPKLKALYVPTGAEYPFVQQCESVTITVDPAHEKYRSADNGIYSKDGTILYQQTGGSASWRVDEKVKTIKKNAFAKNGSIRRLYLPDSVKKIGEGAFSFMENLENVRMSRSVKALKEGTFARCPKLSSLKLPKNVVKLDNIFDISGKNKCKKTIYVNATSLKKGSLNQTWGKKYTAYVKNAKVKKQMKKYGFKGKIVIRK